MRLEITQRADLAVRALVVLVERDRRMKSTDLAATLHTSAGVVPQAMKPLVDAGWVRSVPGPTGGYEPIAALDGLNVRQVVEAVDGPTDNGRCVVSDRRCESGEPCALHLAWGRARDELLDVLAATTVASLVVT